MSSSFRAPKGVSEYVPPRADLFYAIREAFAEQARLAGYGYLELAGLTFTVDHAPGHTPGSVTFRTPKTQEIPDVMFTGDLLFAGSIGRTDLPGGSYEEILASLSRVCLTMPDETAVLPGHGEQTTIGRERVTNPFLAELIPADGPNKGF